MQKLTRRNFAKLLAITVATALGLIFYRIL
jgi:hypothetical protein